MPWGVFQNLISRISKEDLYKFYILENHNQNEVKEYFNISNIDMVYKILTFYGIKKDKNLILEARKNNYNNKTEEEIKAKSLKISQANKGKKLNQETKLKIAEAHRGKTHTSKPQSQEAKDKKSQSLKDFYKNLSIEERKNRNKHIKDYFIDASPEQLEERRLKKSKTLNNKLKEELDETYLKNLHSRDIEPTEEFLYFRRDKEAAIKFLQSNSFRYSDLMLRFNVTYACLTNWLEHEGLSCYLINDKSKYENEISKFLDSLNVKYSKNNRKIIPPKELDFYIPDKNIAIEFNGNYWHSTLNIKDKNYHFNKSKECESKGVRLIHIWEYEWDDSLQREKIKNILRSALTNYPQKINARECEIKELKSNECSNFLNKSHIQMFRGAQVTYGLFYKNELIQIMSFSKSKYNKNLKSDNSWEIIRECSKNNTIIIGGVSKLFTHFIRDYNPEYIFSYCDFNKFTGISYEKLGMEFIGYTGPDMKYMIGDHVVNRNPSKYKYNEKHSIAKLYGAGSKKYLWVKNKIERIKK